MPKHAVALSTHIFGNKPLDRASIELLAEVGIEAIELWTMDPQMRMENLDDAKTIAGWLNSANVRCASVHAPFWMDFGKSSFRWLSLAAPDSAVREKSVELTLRSIEAAELLGAGVVVVHGIQDSDRERAHAEELLWDSLTRLVPAAKKAGVRLAIENIITPFSLTRLIREFVERFGNEHVGICVDVGHAFIDDDPCEALDAAAPYLFEVHIADNMGEEDDHLIPGEGRMVWEPIWDRLARSESLKVATFEIMPPCISGEGELSALERRLMQVRAALDEYRERIDG